MKNYVWPAIAGVISAAVFFIVNVLATILISFAALVPVLGSVLYFITHITWMGSIIMDVFYAFVSVLAAFGVAHILTRYSHTAEKRARGIAGVLIIALYAAMLFSSEITISAIASLIPYVVMAVMLLIVG